VQNSLPDIGPSVEPWTSVASQSEPRLLACATEWVTACPWSHRSLLKALLMGYFTLNHPSVEPIEDHTWGFCQCAPCTLAGWKVRSNCRRTLWCHDLDNEAFSLFHVTIVNGLWVLTLYWCWGHWPVNVALEMQLRRCSFKRLRVGYRGSRRKLTDVVYVFPFARLY